MFRDVIIKNMANLVRYRRDIAVWLIILVGVLLRFLPGLQTDFPINDGGMFLSMIRDLRANRFFLPEVTSYNYSGIPFAYPPLGFYVAAIISSVFSISDIELLRWLPAFVTAAIVPAFYWLSLQLFGNTIKTLISTAVAAVLPGAFRWLVMGGGLSRSFGIFFFLLAVGHTLKLFRGENSRSLWYAILFCALAVLSHPEVGLQTAGICFLLMLVFGRNRVGIRNAGLVSVGTALVTAPWWLTVLIHHGFTPFVSAMQTGIRETLVPSLFYSFFSFQSGVPVLPVLTLLGLFLTLRRKEYLLFGWVFLPFLLDPRNAPAIALYAYVLLSGETLHFFWEKFGEVYSNSMKKNGIAPSQMPFSLTIPFIVLGIYLLWVTFTSSGEFARVSLKKPDRESMDWVRLNTPEDGRFLLMTNTGQVNPMVDSYQEWFPALAERQSQNTLQGSEWILGSRFYEASLRLLDLQACRSVACLRTWALDNDIQIDYVLVRVQRVSPELLGSIQTDDEFQVVYESDSTAIYRSIP